MAPLTAKDVNTQACSIPKRETLSLWSCMSTICTAPHLIILFTSVFFANLSLCLCMATSSSRQSRVNLPNRLCPGSRLNAKTTVPLLYRVIALELCSGKMLKCLNWPVIAINEFIRAGSFILLILLSDGEGQKGLSVCITSHLLGHNVESEPLHYLVLHGLPSFLCKLCPQPSGTGRKIVWYYVQYGAQWLHPGSDLYCHVKRRNTCDTVIRVHILTYTPHPFTSTCIGSLHISIQFL